MYIVKRVTAVLGAALFALAAHISPVSAAVVTPYLNIQTLTGDTGIVSSGGNLVMDATAISIATGSGLLDIVDQDFLLTATYSGSSCDGMMGKGKNCVYSFANGTLSIGSLFTAEVNNLTLEQLCSMGTGSFSADLIYTGGSLQGSLTDGLIEGNFSNATSTDFSRDFSANSMMAEVGPVVVPLPAAFWLFSAGLVGLAGVARRRK